MMRCNRQNGRSGFSITELLVCIVIIMILLAVAIPAYRQAINAAHKARCIGNLHAIFEANKTYQQAYLNGFAPTLMALAGGGNSTCDNAALLSGEWTDPTTVDSWVYQYVNSSIHVSPQPMPGCSQIGFTGWSVTAGPRFDNDVMEAYCISQSGVIRVDAYATPLENLNPCDQSGRPLYGN